MANDPQQPTERDRLDDAEEAKLVADADEGEENLPEFADARDAGAGDALADAGEGAHIEGMVRAGLTMVPEVTLDADVADDRRPLDREAAQLADQGDAASVPPRPASPDAEQRPNP